MNEIRTPQKILHNSITSMDAHTVGVYSLNVKGASELPQHTVSIAVTGSVTGVVSVRARPVGATGFTRIGIESIDLSTATLLTWSVTGFFDAWALVVGTGIAGSGGAAQLIVGSCTTGL